MLEFLFPWTMAAGGILISSPIIIHLINRMRFRRIRWAAMEFLLKSQRRNRRRLIIEQLLLLLLRILLVLLIALIVARFVGFAMEMFRPQNTQHVILLDDTPSMGDHWKDEGDEKDSFAAARNVILEEIAKPATKANTAQAIEIFRLSDLENSRRWDRISNESIPEIENHLKDMKVTALHTGLLRGIERGRELLNLNPQGRRIFYIVSDFRQRDWTGTETETAAKILEGLHQQGKVQIKLIDAAHPARGEGQKLALYHDNLGIVELRPETRVAARHMPVQFTVVVANFSAEEKQNVRVTVKVNGGERAEASLTITKVPPGLTSATFQVAFDQLQANQITANLENEEVGLQIDNTRYAVVEVRERVPILLIDGDLTTPPKEKGDTVSLQRQFDATKGSARGFELVVRSPAELDKPNLDAYPSIYVCNVRELTDRAIQNLEAFVREGGGVAFFMGEKSSPDLYNKKLYAEGKGVFPVPLADRPFPPLSEPELNPEFAIDQLQVFLRADNYARPADMPIFGEVYDYRTYLKYLKIRRYFPTMPRNRWKGELGKVEEVVTLPNRRTVEDFNETAQTILNKFPLEEPKFEKYRVGLAAHQRSIKNLLANSQPLYQLANALDLLLTDSGDPKNAAERPNLKEFWEQPEMAEVRGEVLRFRDTVRYGDPLVLTSRFGKGRVVTFLTSAGMQWNNWEGEFPVSGIYPVMMIELQKYLTSAGGEFNLTVGAPLELQVDATRYETRMRRSFKPETAVAAAGAGDGEARGGVEDRGEQSGVIRDNRIAFIFEEARRPGVYLFDFQPKDGAQVKPEQKAYAFNVDVPSEGDLKRASRDDLETVPTGARLYVPGTTLATEVAPRSSDLSEPPWLYLIFLLVLIFEQALAVHLSFHLKGSEAQAAAPVLGSAGTPA